jgi:hypothetical protein
LAADAARTRDLIALTNGAGSSERFVHYYSRADTTIAAWPRDGRNEIGMNFLTGQTTRSTLAFCRRSLLLACALVVFAASADAQIDKRCAEAAALWIPSSASVEKTVVKWSKSVKYGFVLPRGDDDSIKHSIEETLHLLAQESGLQIELAQDADVAFLVAPEISAVVPGIRNYVEDFLNKLFSSGVYQGKGSVEVDLAKWEAKVQSADVKCAGVDLIVKGAIVRAFNWFQTNESAACVRVG